MPRAAIVIGTILIALAMVTLAALDKFTPTALIPAVIGLLIAICGVIAKNESKRKHAMHGAAGLALFGLLGSLMGAKKWPLILTGQAVERPHAAWEQLGMFIICLIFLIMCVKSFKDARKA